MLGSAVFVLLSWFLFFFVNPFFFRSKLLIILFLFLQSFCFIVNRLTSEPFFSLSHDASFLRHFSGRMFLAGFVFSCWFYLCLYFEILFVLLRDGRGWFELSFWAMYPALRVPPAETRLTVYRRLHISARGQSQAMPSHWKCNGVLNLNLLRSSGTPGA